MWPWRWRRCRFSTRLQVVSTSGQHGANSISTTHQKQVTPSLLELLPTELIHQIASFLTLSSTVPLALCNHILYGVFGTQTLQSLNVNKAEQSLCLQALDRDCLETFHCFFCGRLHTLSPKYGKKKDMGIEERFQKVTERSCLDAEAYYHYCDDFTYHSGFKFEHIQMAAKLRPLKSPSEADAYMA